MTFCQRPCYEIQRLRQVIVVVLWLCVAFPAWFSLGPIWIAAMWPATDRITDFYQDWGSARNHLLGLPIYTRHTMSIPRHLGIPADKQNLIEYNAHPPPAVLLVLPLAKLNYADAVLVWNMISLLALALSLKIVVTAMHLPTTILPPGLALLAFCHPIYGNLYLGQLTLVLLLLVTTSWVLERSGRWCVAGSLVGIAAAIKLFPAYLVIFYLAGRRTSALAAAVFSFLALTFAASFVLGVDSYRDYLSIVIPGQARFWSCGYNLSLAGFWHKLFNPAIEMGLVTPLCLSPAVAWWGTLLSDILITAIVVKCAYRARTLIQRDLAFGVTITAMLLVAPVAWDFSLPLLLVPILLIAYSPLIPELHWMSIVLVLILTIIWIPQNMLTALIQAGRPYGSFSWTFMLGAPSLKFYGLLSTFALGLAAFQAENKKAASLAPER